MSTHQQALPLTCERKLCASDFAGERARALLDQALLPDGAYPHNIISSVYFDDADLGALIDRKSRIQAGNVGRVPAPAEKRFPINCFRE